MKKFVSFLVVCILSMNILNISVFAYTEVDYSSYIGDWQWISESAGEDRFSLGSADLKITECINSYVDFVFSVTSYHFTDEIKGYQIPIVNNTATLTAQGYNNWSWTVTLTFNNDGIWFETDVKNNGFGQLSKSGFQLITHTIEEDNITVKVNGVPLVFDQQPVMKDDRVMVPIRKVFEAMNIDVYFATGATQDGLDFPIVTAIKENTRVTLYVDPYAVNGNSWIMKKGKLTDNGDLQNDNEIQIYTQPIILNGRTLVPVRAITEAFGANVNWDGSTQTVIITGDTSGQRKSDEEIKRVDEFDSKAACNIAKEKYYVFYAYEWPGYDSKGKYYTLSVSDNGMQNGNQSSIKVYIDGTIVEED